MKKLFYALVLMAAGLGFVACDDDEAKNPGDFNLKSTLEMDTKIVSTQGFECQLELLESRDTTYEYQVTKYDTLKDENNKPILDAEGKLQITTETSWVKGGLTAKMHEYKLVTLPSKADTFTLALKSNARWKAPVPSAGGKVQWYYNYNLVTGSTSTSGGGDGNVYFRVTRNRNKKRSVEAVQDIMTSDSTVLVRLHFTQSGERDK